MLPIVADAASVAAIAATAVAAAAVASLVAATLFDNNLGYTSRCVVRVTLPVHI